MNGINDDLVLLSINKMETYSNGNKQDTSKILSSFDTLEMYYSSKNSKKITEKVTQLYGKKKKIRETDEKYLKVLNNAVIQYKKEAAMIAKSFKELA